MYSLTMYFADHELVFDEITLENRPTLGVEEITLDDKTWEIGNSLWLPLEFSTIVDKSIIEYCQKSLKEQPNKIEIKSDKEVWTLSEPKIINSTINDNTFDITLNFASASVKFNG